MQRRRPSVRGAGHPSVGPWGWPSVRRSVGLAICPSVRGAGHLSVGPWGWPSVHRSVGLSVHRSVGLAVHLSVGLAIRPSVGLAVLQRGPGVSAHQLLVASGAAPSQPGHKARRSSSHPREASSLSFSLSAGEFPKKVAEIESTSQI